MNEGNYIKINRSILSWEWYKDSNTKNLFFHMLLKANWRAAQFRGIDIKRGSFASSYQSLSSETGLSIQNIRTSIRKLKSTGEITVTNYRKFTVFTVNNYCEYQETNKIPNTELTFNQHSTNTQLTTIEEIKNKRNKEVYRDDKSSLRQTETVRRVVEAWNCLSEYGIRRVSRLNSGSKRYNSLTARLNEYGEEEVMRAIENIKHSDFLQGKEPGKSWAITFDWFVLPSNFPKVLEGNYENREHNAIKAKVRDNNNFERRNYDMDKLERQLMEGQFDE